MKCNYCDKDKPERMFNKKDLSIGKCRECNNKCEHGKRKSNCLYCGNGKQICEHNKIVYNCLLCIACEHGKRTFDCIECSGSGICKHNKRKRNCIDCNGSGICEHNKRRNRCVDCNGSGICEHKNVKYTCVDCGGNGICEHKVEKRRCVKCNGNDICSHNRVKTYCIICNPIGNFISRQRAILRSVLKTKYQTTNEYLGCDKVFLYNHIKSQMTPEMTFENIHIDHIKPISKFDLTKEEEIKKCFHWSNLQPLLVEDNLSKSNKWSDEEEDNWKNIIIQI